MRLTDGQTDRIPIAIPRLHSMQRGKNSVFTELFKEQSLKIRQDSTEPLISDNNAFCALGSFLLMHPVYAELHRSCKLDIPTGSL